MLYEFINIIFNKKRIENSKNIDYESVKQLLKNNKNCFLIDVRSSQEYKEGHIENSINIPLYDINKKVNKIIKNKEDIIIVYCQTGNRSKKAIKILLKLGYRNIYNLEDGYEFLK